MDDCEKYEYCTERWGVGFLVFVSLFHILIMHMEGVRRIHGRRLKRVGRSISSWGLSYNT